MDKKQQIQVGKLLYGLYIVSFEMIDLLKDKKSFVESNMYQVRSVNYGKVKGVYGDREKVLLHQLEQKDKLEKYISFFTSLQESVDSLLLLMEEEELTPYIIGKDQVDMEEIMDKCGYSERTAYRKYDYWFSMLTLNLLKGR